MNRPMEVTSSHSPDSSGLKTIGNLSPSLIPPRLFAITRWYIGASSWYYHRPGRPKAHPATEDAAYLIDPDLRRLCEMLYRCGLGTTPSCQGHFYDWDYFEDIWANLTDEAELIRREGLVMRDSETDERRLFRNPGYRLPWPDMVSFCQQATACQSTGYLGIVIPGHRRGTFQLLRQVSVDQSMGQVRTWTDLDPVAGSLTLSLEVRAGDPKRQSAIWADLTDAVNGVLQSEFDE